MALKIGDAENFQVKEENTRLRNLIPQIVNSLMIGAHPPGELPPYVPPDKPNSPYEPGKSPAPSRPSFLAHAPGGIYDFQGRPLDKGDIPWEGLDPSGNRIEIPWLKEQYEFDRNRREQLHQLKYHPEEQLISDHRGTTNYLDSKGRSTRTGSFRDSGLSNDKLIEALKIGAHLMQV